MKFVPDRLEFIKNLVRGKDVLDLGSLGCAFNPKTVPFDVLEGSAKSFVGVDLNPSDHPNMKQGDVETVKLNKKFDVIIAGDIIEHIDNPGIFLKNMKSHLKKEGVLLISTPNIRSRCVLPFYKTNPEHTLWHDRQTIQTILERYGYKISEFHAYPGNKKLFFPLETARFILYSLFPILAEGMIVLAKIK